MLDSLAPQQLEVVSNLKKVINKKTTTKHPMQVLTVVQRVLPDLGNLKQKKIVSYILDKRGE